MKENRNILFWTILTMVLFFVYFFILAAAHPALGAPPKSSKSKFYDFNEQIIDGQIRKPTALYTDARQKAKFDRLLRLKKSFLGKLFETSKEKVFK